MYGPLKKSWLIFFYLKRCNQCVKINNIHNVFEMLLFGVLQGSILGPILVDIFINNLFCWLIYSELHNLADGNTISTAEFSIEKLLKTLERKCEIATDWFKQNEMIVKTDKFQVIVVKVDSNVNGQYTLHCKKY